MKVAVYDEWWATAGGGEKFAAGIAQVLADDHDVELLTHEPVDLEDLSQRLQLDLSGVAAREIAVGQAAVEAASAGYDFFVNASYMSRAHNRAKHGLYVVHFPNPPVGDGTGWKAVAKRALRPLVAMPGVGVQVGAGFYPPEQIGRYRAQWTNGDGEVVVWVPEGEELEVTLRFGRFLGRGLDPVPVTIHVDGTRMVSLALRPRTSRLEPAVIPVSVPIRGKSGGEPVHIRIISATHVPAEAFGTGDTRRLGVPVTGVHAGPSLKAIARLRYPSLAASPADFGFVKSYDRVVSNSEYTRSWVRRWWEIDTDVLYPPVTMQPRGDKQNIILNVGRFFSPDRGHCKKQLDLVRAMRAIAWRGRLPGWTLHLVGGCAPADQEYLDKVRKEAQGLPVEIHVDASGAELRDLYSRASIYWHATGLGEDPETQPDRFEHFGITTVEAMSAGAVPVVIFAAGQAEIVEHGVNGLLWEPLVQLVCFTEDLALDDERRERMSAAAQVRARDFGFEAFGERLLAIVSEIVGT
ncbi:MAG: glycosyltransferase family 4 protein [Acidimicrobiales bacterium]|nr:glycosyltransferase family 4 protein [Acidimicrobiales bacterium]